jgi:hypothetical protein
MPPPTTAQIIAQITTSAAVAAHKVIGVRLLAGGRPGPIAQEIAHPSVESTIPITAPRATAVKKPKRRPARNVNTKYNAMEPNEAYE